MKKQRLTVATQTLSLAPRLSLSPVSETCGGLCCGECDTTRSADSWLVVSLACHQGELDGSVGGCEQPVSLPTVCQRPGGCSWKMRMTVSGTL